MKKIPLHNLLKSRLKMKHNSWKDLTEISQLDKIADASQEKPQFIFKHSTRCGVSHQVMSGLNDSWDLDSSQQDFYYLDLLNFREISNTISEKFGVFHQSPQLIIIKDGKVIDSYSHYSINFDKVMGALG